MIAARTLELVPAEDVPRRVVRMAQEQHAGAGPELVAQPVEVELASVEEQDRHQLSTSVGHDG